MNLNPQQQEAVNTINGALLITAAPGSGKTRVVTERIKNILRQGYSPHDIVAVTFTNSAAHEMEERLKADIEENVVRNLTICTFHRLAMKIIREFGYLIGRDPDFCIYDSSDQLDVIRAIMKDLGMKKPSAENVLKNKHLPKYKVLFGEYHDRLRAANAFDFDMLIESALYLLEERQEVREKMQYKCRFISVDEFQDINEEQYRMTRILSGKWGNVCAVGDCDQNVFSFAGSDVRFMIRFREDFENVKAVAIATTYRCPANVLASAAKLVKNNPNRLDTEPTSIHADGTLQYLVFDNDFEEAAWITRKCESLIGNGSNPSDIAILGRSHRVIDTISQVMRNGGLDVNVCGRTRSLMEETAAKDLHAHLRMLANPHDRFSFRRTMKINGQVPFRNTVAIEALSRAADINLIDATRQYLISKDLDSDYVDKIEGLKSLTFGGIIENIVSDLRIIYEKQHLLTRCRDLTALQLVIGNMVSRDSMITVEDYLEDVAELSAAYDAIEGEEETPGVNLMTVHTAKGLEWPIVFVPALESGSFPVGSNPDPDALEEERRLFYVALTRAKSCAFITRARVRNIWGRDRDSEESPFIKEAGLERL